LNASDTRLRIFVVHASHNLTNYKENGDGLVAWGYLAELARRGHSIYAVTDKLDVLGDVPPNLTLVECPRRTSNGILHYIRYMARVRALYDRVASSEGVDVVHQMNPVVRGLSLALLGRDVPLVLGTYVGDWKPLRFAPNYRPPSLKERCAGGIKTVLDAFQQYHADAIMLTTPHALSRVPLAFTQTDRIRFLHHGVDTTLFTCEPQDGDPPPHPLSILFLGALRESKGAQTLLEAFRLVAAEIPEAQLLFIGRGPVDPWKRRLEEYGLANRARFFGSLPRTEVARWLRACTVLCAPSFGEPYGQNVLEAMASGKPVVGTSEGGHRYLLDSAGSYQIRPGDRTALAEALIAVLKNPVRARGMGDHNRRLVEARNSWTHLADELEEVYCGAMRRRGRDRGFGEPSVRDCGAQDDPERLATTSANV
jgi:glycosyltransferase involved in cell wall biosynthesis